MEPKSLINLRPLYDRIVVKRIEEAETTRSGIIIPDSAKQRSMEGEVIAAGRGKRDDDGTLIPLDVQVGDRVLFGMYSGNETNLSGAEYLILSASEVLAVVEPVAVVK